MKVLRRMISLMLTASLCLLCAPVSAESRTYPLGDVDLDGEVAAGDLTTLARAVGDIESLPGDFNTYSNGKSGIHARVRDMNDDGTVKVACVGDSITQGLGNTPYPTRLSRLLGNGFKVENFGLWGTTGCNNTDRPYTTAADSPYERSLSFAPEVVLIMLGTNDGGSDASNAAANLKSDLRSLIKSYQALDSHPLIVLMTSPTSYLDNYANVTNVIAPIQRELAREMNLPLLDVNALTTGMPDQFQDGLHPSESGYFYLALMIYERVFGGSVCRTTVQTEPRAIVKLNAYETFADDFGSVTFAMASGEQTLEVKKEGFETARATVTVPYAAACTITCGMVPAANLALNATAFDNGCAVYGGTAVASTINDGDCTSGGWQPAEYAEGDYVGLTLDSTQTVGFMTLYWESDAYISKYQDGGFEVWIKKPGSDWEKTTALTVTRTNADVETGTKLDTVAFTSPVAVDGVRVVVKNGTIGDHKYAPKLYEMGLYGESVGTPTVAVRETEAYAAYQAYPFGDINLDGDVTASDLTVLARKVGGIEDLPDVNAYSCCSDIDEY